MVSIVMAGGGTAGHTSPLIATAGRLVEIDPQARITCVGTPKGLESRVIPEAGLELRMIPPVPMPRRLTPQLLTVPGRLGGAVAQAGRILADVRADVVVGFGGYASMPVYLAALARRIPVVLHEQNAVPGLANKAAAKFAAAVCVTFPGTPLPRAEVVGMPLRAGIVSLDRAHERLEAQVEFGFTGNHPVLLVSGGSQGARSLNVALNGCLDELLASGVDVLHVLGEANFDPARHDVRIDSRTGGMYRPLAYVAAMERAYAAADLMVARSGAGTVMETAVVGLPCVFVPLPHGNGEQARNARFLVEADAGLLIPDAEFTAKRMRDQVLELFTEVGRLPAMEQRLQGLVSKDAAGVLAERILDAVARKNR